MKTYLIIIAVIATLGLAIFAYTKKDEWFAAKYNKHTEAAVIHTAAAVVAGAKTDSIKKEGVKIVAKHNALINTPEVKNDTTAMKVVVSSNKVIANKDSTIKSQDSTVKELKLAAKETKAAGDKPTPRWIPYVDVLALVQADSNSVNKPILNVRAGIDYHLISNNISAKIELSHARRTEFNVGIHITFR